MENSFVFELRKQLRFQLFTFFHELHPAQQQGRVSPMLILVTKMSVVGLIFITSGFVGQQRNRTTQ